MKMRGEARRGGWRNKSGGGLWTGTGVGGRASEREIETEKGAEQTGGSRMTGGQRKTKCRFDYVIIEGGSKSMAAGDVNVVNVLVAVSGMETGFRSRKVATKQVMDVIRCRIRFEEMRERMELARAWMGDKPTEMFAVEPEEVRRVRRKRLLLGEVRSGS
ncbi:hypothetical protein GQ607_000162 [Colletotrichum asianum]|uniref:Uncharacterized protein n=1 Tax=Colletotrichum asianum TaxID=702518 RepID=A0A8H3WP48_9PEZI|nr:hypothetical protein GQ607_000162 [Colletotrichum asianum]